MKKSWMQVFEEKRAKQLEIPVDAYKIDDPIQIIHEWGHNTVGTFDGFNAGKTQVFIRFGMAGCRKFYMKDGKSATKAMRLYSLDSGTLERLRATPLGTPIKDD